MIESLLKGRQKVSNQLKAVKFKLRHTKLVKKSLDDIKTFKVLKEGSENNISSSPKYPNACHYELSYPEVDIKLYQLNNIYCNIESSSFINESIDSAYIEEFPYIPCQDANYKAGFLVRHDTQYAYIKNIKKDQVKKLKSAFFLGGNGSFNFYHWMLEIVPKLLFLSNEDLIKLNLDTIIINECVQQSDNYQWILSQCLRHLDNINIVYVKPKDILFVEELFFLNTFNQTVFNFNSLLEDYRTATIFNRESIEKLRSRLLDGCCESISQEKTEHHKKIFILRSEDGVSSYNKRGYNQNEIFKFFEEKGFVGIYPDKLSVSDQISLFQNADFIVGPTGASWSNLLFANKGTKAISWLPSQLKNFDTYCSLAGIVGIDMHFIKYETQDEYAHGPYQLEVKEVSKLYKLIK